MSALKSYFPPGYPRNIWHLLLLISAFFATAFTIVDLVLISGETFPILLLMLGFVVLALFCLWKAAGCVRYWAMFLWSGLFLMVGATFCSSHSSSAITYQLFHLLAGILLFVFFWNLGRFDWRIGVPLLLLCLAFFGVAFYPAMDLFNVFPNKASVFFAGFLVLYCLSVILALSARKLPGFPWLIAGPSLLLFAVLLIYVLDLLFGHNEQLMFDVLAYFFILLPIFPILMIVGASLFTLKMDPAKLEEMLRKATPVKEVDAVFNSFGLASINAFRSFFATDFPKRVWHRLLLISAFLVTVFTIVDLVHMMFFSSVYYPVSVLLLMLGLVVFALLAFFFLRKAIGCVRYWASFLWLGLFLLFAGGIFIHLESYSIPHQLVLLLGNILLLVFFWNQGNFNRRTLARLFLIFTPLSGIMFLSGLWWNIADVRLMFGFTIVLIIYFVFYSLFVITDVNSIKLLKLSGFRWLFAGFSLILFAILLILAGNSYFKNNIEPFFPFLFILILISTVLMTVGASIFTRKMDPAKLEEMLRKASLVKEVDTVSNSSGLASMNAFISCFATGFPKNVWQLLLLISALFAIVFTIVDLVCTNEARFILPPISGLVVLVCLCLLKASGCVRYWASFLWLGLFLLAAVSCIVFLNPFLNRSFTNLYLLFYLLGDILLLVFFWNLGNFNRRILALLFLIFTLIPGMVLIVSLSEPRWWDTTEAGLMYGTICIIVYFVFYSLFVIMTVNSMKLPGFLWLFVAFSLLFPFWFVALVFGNLEILDKNRDWYFAIFFPPIQFLLLIFSLIFMMVGASFFTLKMDPAKLEERLRKATPAKEVDSGI